MYSHDQNDEEESSHADDEDVASFKGEQIVDDEGGQDDDFDMVKFDKGAKLPAHKKNIADDEEAMETEIATTSTASAAVGAKITVNKKDWDALVDRLEQQDGRLSELETIVRELYRKRKATESQQEESEPKRRKV